MTAADSTDSGDGAMEPDNGDTEESGRPHPLRNWRQPLLTAVGMFVSVGLVAIVDPLPGPLVLAAVLAMTLARNRLVTTWRGRAEAIILLPLVGLATAGVGYLFVRVPIVGAGAYVVALFLSIWLRRFGPTGSRVGSLIALPFITLLIAPGGGAGTTALSVALLSIVVLIVVVGLRVLAETARLIPRTRPVEPIERAPAESASSPSTRHASPSTRPAAPSTRPASPRPPMRPIASTRMSIHMAIALAAAFVVGYLVFPQHVTWVVLTAFIVCSGNRGRADVVYKSGLRIVGAALGTVVASIGLALVPSGQSILQGPLLVVVLLVIIAIGLWLREWSYAAWAVVMTLVITLLQGVALQGAALHGAAVPAVAGAAQIEGGQLWMRILAIVVGAACGIAASWFVLPVRSEGVVRRRVADALFALGEFASTPDPTTDEELAGALSKLDEVAAPWAVWERISRWRTTTRKPGQWMNLVHECAALVRAAPELSAEARRALGHARRSMREPIAIGAALVALRDELRRGVGA